MAGEAENIGGIEVQASISDQGVDAQLNALLARMQAAARQMSAALTITPGAAAGQGGQTGAQRQQQQARTQGARQARQQEQQDEEQGRLGFQTRMAAYEMRTSQQHEARVQGHRRTAAQRAFSESERQRKADLAAQSKQYDTLATLATRYFDDQEKRAGAVEAVSSKAADQRSLREMSYQAEQDAQAPTSASFAPQRAPGAAPYGAGRQSAQSTEEQRRARSQQLADDAELRRQQQAQAGGAERRAAQERARADADKLADDRAAVASRRGRSVSEEQRERAIEANIERQRAGTTASGRTGRTAAFGQGALFGGTQGRFIEASQRQSAAMRELNKAEGDALPIRRRLAEYDLVIAKSSGEVQQGYIKRRQAFVTNKDNVDVIKREVTATHDLADANAELRSLQGPRAIAQNFIAGAAGGAAFGLAIAGISAATKALGPTLAEVVDSLGGFSIRSTAVTSALAQQTIAQKGNVDAVLAQQAATAGLSSDAADYLNTQLKLTTQVKAGALAQKQSSDLFKAAGGTNQNVPQGLNGGYGGLFNTPFLGTELGGGTGFRETTAGNVRQFGGASTSTTGRFGDVPGTINDLLGSLNPLGENFGDPGKQIQLRDSQASLAAGNTPGLSKQIDDLNEAAKRAATSTGQQVSATFAYTNSAEDVAKAVAIASAAGDTLGESMASMGLVVRDASGNIADFTTQMEAWSQAAAGKGIPAAENLGKIALAQEQQRQREAAASVPALQSQFAYERPAFLASTQRDQQYQQYTQLPAQRALANLAQPLLAPSTGLTGTFNGQPIAANAKEQDKINEGLKGANDLQDQLNAKYAEGYSVLQNTYKPELIKNFGQAAGQAFQAGLDTLTATGQKIASLQSGIINEQAAYQVAQYNEQLRLSRQSLSDIGGLTGKNFGAGQSYLGVLEKQNLALSRQGQLLQFGLQQRQINYQVALAGFQTPGVTPEERQANVKEAQVEASYAQKQLDIQQKMFGNQVQIVDIQNLRQGVNLAKQIGLLVQGRAVTIDVKIKTEELQRQQALQQQTMADVQTFVNQVDTIYKHDFAQITALETAAGKAMYSASTYAAGAFSNYLSGITTALTTMASSLGGINTPTTGTYHAQGRGPTKASGFLGNVTGASPMTVGEAGTETVAVLRNPRAMAGLGGGGGVVNITFGDVTVRSAEDIDEITRRVTKALGRDAALKGLRSN